MMFFAPMLIIPAGLWVAAWWLSRTTGRALPYGVMLGGSALDLLWIGTRSPVRTGPGLLVFSPQEDAIFLSCGLWALAALVIVLWLLPYWCEMRRGVAENQPAP